MTEEEQRLSELPNWENHFELMYIKGRYNPCRILDFGCGYGFSDIHLARAGFTVTGYDSDPERIKIAKYMASFESEDVRSRLSFHADEVPEGEYFLVWMSHILEHIPTSEWGVLMAGIRTKTPAKFVVSVPLKNAYDMPLHVNHWESEVDLWTDLQEFAEGQWGTWEDAENRVIKAESI
jgi:SAM-dependent methyltransferase